MPEIVEDTYNQGLSNAMDGAKYGLGRGIGGAVLGPIGYGIGGVAAASTLSSESEKQTLSTLAIADGLTMLLGLQGGGGGGGGGGSARGVK